MPTTIDNPISLISWWDELRRKRGWISPQSKPIVFCLGEALSWTAGSPYLGVTTASQGRWSFEPATWVIPSLCHWAHLFYTLASTWLSHYAAWHPQPNAEERWPWETQCWKNLALYGHPIRHLWAFHETIQALCTTSSRWSAVLEYLSRWNLHSWGMFVT